MDLFRQNYLQEIYSEDEELRFKEIASNASSTFIEEVSHSVGSTPLSYKKTHKYIRKIYGRVTFFSKEKSPSIVQRMSLEEQNDAPYFSLQGHKCMGKIVKVYDADTVHILMEVFGTLYRWKCRIMHVDTPELRTKDENEKKHGYIAK